MKSNQIKQAFESVQADSDLADRVLYAAAGEPLRRKGHAKPLYVAVIGCLAGVLATGGVAYAVVNSSYFASAWGNHGNEESITWTQGGSSGTKYTYTREFGDGIAPQSLEGSATPLPLLLSMARAISAPTTGTSTPTAASSTASISRGTRTSRLPLRWLSFPAAVAIVPMT